MSALERLKAYVLVHYEDCPPVYVAAVMPQIDAEVQELYDAVAAELAEKIRRAPFSKHLLQKHQQETAALIDPEVP